MRAWLTRNVGPIGSVVAASVVVVGVFELLDVVAASSPVVSAQGEAEMSGVASLAGLIKVSIFLGIGALIARPLRRRVGKGATTSTS